jgi:hypothetical protein
MSTPSSAKPAAEMHPTRQQLDELDALLRRMLDLPVQPADAAPSAATPPEPEPALPAEAHKPREKSPTGPPVSYVVIETAGPSTPEPAAAPQAPRPEAEPEGWIPFRSSWQPSPQTWGPLAESWKQARTAGLPAPPAADSRTAVAEPSSPPAVVDSAPEPKPMPATAPAAPAASPPLTLTWNPPARPRALAPLIWFNRLFDACLTPLAGPGRWLRGSGGRSFLGFVGLACLGAAVARALTGGILPWTR